MATYDIGDVVSLAVNVKDSDGNLANATAVVLTLTLPDGTTTTPSVNNTSTGVYEATYTTTQAGRHVVSWVATGTNASAFTDVFNVLDTDYPIVSLAEVKAYLNITSTTHDEELRRMLRVASDAGEQYTGRVFGKRTLTREFSGDGSSVLLLPYIPVVSISSLTISGSAVTDYKVLTGGVVTRENLVWPSGVNNISVTYTAGYAVQPAADIQGTLEMVRHMWQTQRGSVMSYPRGDDEWSPGQAFSLPRRVMDLWDSDRRPGI